MEGRLAAMFVDTDGRQGLEMAAEKGKSGMKKKENIRCHGFICPGNSVSV